MSQIFYREMPAPGQRSLYHSEDRWSRPKSSCACLERGVDTEEGAARLCLSAAHLNKPLARVRMARANAVRDSRRRKGKPLRRPSGGGVGGEERVELTEARIERGIAEVELSFYQP